METLDDRVKRAVASASSAPSSKPELVVAAKLIEGSAGCAGLASALEELARCAAVPDDVGAWIARRVRAQQLHAARVEPSAEPVLPGLMMKCDEFAGIHALASARVHPEVWNFRRTKSELPIFGVGQCHLGGLMHNARHLGALGFARAVCFNMREEPLVFLNGTGCAPRVAGKLDENVDYLLSIQGYELDAMELRLKEDCCAASERALADGGLLIWEQPEGGDGSNVQRPVVVARERSFAVREAYAWVNAQPPAAEDGALRARLEYVRVPIADETAPEEQDFDQLVDELRALVAARDGAAEATALVFNCHMGRGRTTTGMVCGSILMRAARGWAPPAAAGDGGALPEPGAEGRDLARGEFSRVLALLKQVDSVGGAGLGRRSKLLVDSCADDCDEVTNLVEAPGKCIAKAAAADERARTGGEATRTGLSEDARGSAFWTHRGVKYLERYAWLLLFAAYAQLNAESGFATTFSEWMHRHWGFKRTIRELELN